MLDSDEAFLFNSFDKGLEPDLLKLFRYLESKGLSFGSAIFAPFRRMLNERGSWKNMSHALLMSSLGSASESVKSAMDGTLSIDDWERFVDCFSTCFDGAKANTSGQVCQSIASLKLADPNVFAAAFSTTAGQSVSIGDAATTFTIQSVSKMLSLALVLETRGAAEVFAKLGKTASGRAYNSQRLMDAKAPNGCVNAGALAAAAMLPGDSLADCFSRAIEFYAQLAGLPTISCNTATYYIEKASAFDNDSIISILAKNGLVDPSKRQEIVDVYTQLCAAEMSVESLAIVGATLANMGMNPLTHKRLMSNDTVKEVLGQMSTAGMYEESGSFYTNHGVHSKSGVSGAVLFVVPGVGGGAAFSPRLNCYGNSSRSITFIGNLVAQRSWHHLERLCNLPAVTRRQAQVQLKEQMATTGAKLKVDGDG